eukprot:g15328.t1
MDCVCKDTMYKALDDGGKNVPNAAHSLMATFLCGYINLCVEPRYATTKCHFVLRFYLSPVLQRMGLALLQSAPSSWTIVLKLEVAATK